MRSNRPKIDPDIRRDYHFDDPAIVDEFEERLLMGEPVWSICSDPLMPSRREFYVEINRETEIGKRLGRARENSQSAVIDRTIEIADKATMANYKIADIRIKSRQWAAMKIAPKKYGELVVVEAKGKQSNVTKVVIVNDPENDTSPDDEDRNGTEGDL